MACAVYVPNPCTGGWVHAPRDDGVQCPDRGGTGSKSHRTRRSDPRALYLCQGHCITGNQNAKPSVTFSSSMSRKWVGLTPRPGGTGQPGPPGSGLEGGEAGPGESGGTTQP